MVWIMASLTARRLVEQDPMHVHMLPPMPLTIGRLYPQQSALSAGQRVVFTL